MPESRKRVKNEKKEVVTKNYNPLDSKFGKVLLLILCVGMVLAIVIAAIVLIIQRF